MNGTRRTHVSLLAGVLFAASASAVDFYFQPGTYWGDAGDTLLLSGMIGPSDTMRGFTIYLIYDTNRVDLVPPPTAGSLLAGRPGLDFRYLDHVPAAPNWLEIGATVFSTSYWAGPGELFQLRFVFRECGRAPVSGEIGFRRPSGMYVPGVYVPPAFVMCDLVPRAPTALTIQAVSEDSVVLRWNHVRGDTSGFPLPAPPVYHVYREQVFPLRIPPALAAVVPDTFFVDATAGGVVVFHYFVSAQVTRE